MSVLPERAAGVCLHLTSLPGRYGIGGLGPEAFRWIDELAAMGLRVWQFLPIGPTTYGDSPYQSSSVFAGNPLLVDPGDLVERGLVGAEELEPLQTLPSERVDFARLIPLKTQLLARAGERFASRSSATERRARDQFVTRHDRIWLHDYALFEALKSMHQQRAWMEWERIYTVRDPDELATLEHAAHAQVEAVKTVQYLFFAQWNKLRAYASSRGIKLMGDVPIYVALDSADAWARPELLCLDTDGKPTEVAGVPPDYFSADGQLWGNPLYRWDRHAADGFSWWIARLGHAMRAVDIVRLDHFRGFEAYWAVPAGDTSARGGQWRSGPGTALFDALGAALGALPFVAEDLGVITPAVDALRTRYGFPGMRVLQFEVGEEHFDPMSIPENSVCYTGTHDNDTTVGWFHGSFGDVRTADDVARIQRNVLRHTGGRASTIHWDLIQLAFSTQAALVIAPLQDFLGLDSSARMNTPGTTLDNWRWRVRAERLTPEFFERVHRIVDAAGRIGTS